MKMQSAWVLMLAAALVLGLGLGPGCGKSGGEGEDGNGGNGGEAGEGDGGGTRSEGFESPEKAFEAMKEKMNKGDFDEVLPYIVPGERAGMVFLFHFASGFAGRGKENAGEIRKEFADIREKHNVAEKPEGVSGKEIGKMFAAEDKTAFLETAETFLADVDLEAYYEDLCAFVKKHSDDPPGDDPAVEMKDLETREDRAKARVVHESGEQKTAIFKKVDGRWFYSVESMME